MPDDTPAADDSPLRKFAAGLQNLHREAGKPDYRELSRRTGYGRTVLSAALNGSRLPTWPVTRSLVRALGAEPDDWRSRWAATSQALAAADGVDPTGADPSPPAADEPPSPDLAKPPSDGRPIRAAGAGSVDRTAGVSAPGRRRWSWPVLGGVAAVTLLVTALGGWAAVDRLSGPPAARTTPERSLPATGPGSGITGGVCIRVTAADVRVFTSATGMDFFTTWKTDTRFWSDPRANTRQRYRTVLRDGRPAWVTASGRYTAPADGCP